MIVIDVGCARYGGDYSVERLWEMFHPARLIGYDPSEETAKMALDLVELAQAGEVLQLHQEAAWIYDGKVGYFADGLNSQIGDSAGWPMVRCVDLARVIRELPESPVILKIDAEGAEYELLEHLLATGAMERVSRLLIEWHKRGEGQRRHEIEMAIHRLQIPTEQWRW